MMSRVRAVKMRSVKSVAVELPGGPCRILAIDALVWARQARDQRRNGCTSLTMPGRRWAMPASLSTSPAPTFAERHRSAFSRGISFKQALNSALRAGLGGQRRSAQAFKQYSPPMGVRAGFKLDKACNSRQLLKTRSFSGLCWVNPLDVR
jgi:hypothetical protein